MTDGHAVAVLKLHTGCRDRIDVWRLERGAAVAAEWFDANVVREDENDVWLLATNRVPRKNEEQGTDCGNYDST